jgi:plastocyanin
MLEKIFLFCTLLTSACAFGDSSAPAAEAASTRANYTVTIENMQFSPARLAVHAGDRIVFSNKDLFPHTVTADGNVFDSKGIASNASWSYRAGKPGTYPYHCSLHAMMKGTLTVR